MLILRLGLAGTTLKVARQEYAGQVSAHVHCDVARDAVITVRAGVFKPAECGAAAGKILDRSAAVPTRRRARGRGVTDEEVARKTTGCRGSILRPGHQGRAVRVFRFVSVAGSNKDGLPIVTSRSP